MNLSIRAVVFVKNHVSTPRRLKGWNEFKI